MLWEQHLKARNPLCLADYEPLRIEDQAYLSTEVVVRDGLGGGEGGGAGGVAQGGVEAGELIAHSQVSDLHPPVLAQKQVRRLDVPMNDSLEVHWNIRHRQLISLTKHDC